MGMNFGMGYPLSGSNMTPQQRLYQYEQQMQIQNQMQPPMQHQTQLPAIRSYYVGSIDEAKGVQTPYDGSIIVLINKAMNEVYIKKANDDGSPSFSAYSQIEIKNTSNDDILGELKKRIEILEQQKESSYPITKFKKDKEKGSKENDE